MHRPDARGRRSCRRRVTGHFTKTCIVGYELERGADTVWWTMAFDPATGVRFGLDKPDVDPDLLFRGKYDAFVDFTRLSKTGQAGPFPLTFSGNPNVYMHISEAFAAASQVATVDTRFS
ncbi:hypothetical protein [Solimonas terrae]|uniref:Uncharacterized protein n=1 Tax=Solimonas terrae TaxID=1396819 RepID=A0A6M2BPK9_9GAMM|nr:hypothetical protein [Solimonas terrae]NGY04135.1 hypothetical protein [Solimonas terrae]